MVHPSLYRLELVSVDGLRDAFFQARMLCEDLLQEGCRSEFRYVIIHVGHFEELSKELLRVDE